MNCPVHWKQKVPVFIFPTSVSRYWHVKKKKKKRHKVISVIFHFLYTLYLPPLLFLHKRQIWVVQVIAWVMAILGNEIFAETLCPWKLIHKNTGGIVEAVKEDSNGFSILLCQLSSCFFHFVVLFIWRSECIFFFLFLKKKLLKINVLVTVHGWRFDRETTEDFSCIWNVATTPGTMEVWYLEINTFKHILVSGSNDSIHTKKVQLHSHNSVLFVVEEICSYDTMPVFVNPCWDGIWPEFLQFLIIIVCFRPLHRSE